MKKQSEVFINPITGFENEMPKTKHSKRDLFEMCHRLIADLFIARAQIDIKDKEYPFIPEDFDFLPVKNQNMVTTHYKRYDDRGFTSVLCRMPEKDNLWRSTTQNAVGIVSQGGVAFYLKNSTEARIVLQSLKIIPEYSGSILAKISVPNEEVGTEAAEEVIFNPTSSPQTGNEAGC